MLWVWAILLILVLLICWALNLLGIPGNWINLAAAGVYAWLMPEHRTDFGWWVIGILLVLAILGEVIEFAAGAAGVAKEGGSRRGAALAMVGSLVGGVVGLMVGLPIPVVGSVLAALLFSCLGALLGAMAGEGWKGRDFEKSLAVGQAAFWGRLLGTMGKIVVGCAMIVVVVVAVVV